MKKSFLFFLCLILGCMGCAEKKPELLVDEIYISVHKITYQWPYRKYYPPGSKKLSEITYDTTEYPFCFKGIDIANSRYHPKLIVQVDRNGKLKGYIKNCERETEGYYETTLKDSLIKFINSQINEMNYKNLGTIYFTKYRDSDDMEIVENYFFSIKDGKNEKKIFIDKYKCPKGIIKLTDWLFKYLDRMRHTTAPDQYFRKDTLIVLRTEQIRDSLHKIYSGKELD